MKNIFITTIILFTTVISLFADNNNAELMQKANSLYVEGKYEEAIKEYKKILETEEVAAELFYNLGNCYYRINNFTEAIYYYEKAKMICPNDKDINENLKMANLQIVDKITPLPQFFGTRVVNNIIRSKNSIFWANLSILTFVVLLSAILIYLFSKIKTLKIISFFSGILLLLISTTTFIFANKQYHYQTSHTQAIVFSPSVVVKSEPEAKATELFIIHEGLKVDIQKNSNDWCQIRLVDGKEGWLKKSDIKVL